MDMTWTIRYEGRSYQEAMILRGMLEEEGVHVQPPPTREQAVLEVRQQRQRVGQQLEQLLEWLRQPEQQQLHYEGLEQIVEQWLGQQELDPQERDQLRKQLRELLRQFMSQMCMFVDDINQVIVTLVSTGSLVAINSAVKKFRKRAPHGKVEIEVEAQGPGDNSGKGSLWRYGAASPWGKRVQAGKDDLDLRGCCVRGGSAPMSQCVLTGEFTLGGAR